MQKDPYLLLQGDSTGNEDWEFFFLTVQKLCADYPTHTVYYRTWNTTTLTWEGRTLQTGTSARVLRIYNGSVPGATPAYWQGTLKDYAYDGFQFDMVIVNYGLNVSTDAIIQKSSLSAYLYTLNQSNLMLRLCLIFNALIIQMLFYFRVHKCDLTLNDKLSMNTVWHLLMCFPNSLS